MAVEANGGLQDRDAFHRGVSAGLATGARELRTAHAERALCDPSGAPQLCEYCEAYHRMRMRSVEDRERWSLQTQDPDLVFVILQSDKIHIRDCPLVVQAVALAEQRLETLTPYHAKHGGGTVTWPQLVSRPAALASNRHRCRTCAPDLPERVPRRPPAPAQR